VLIHHLISDVFGYQELRKSAGSRCLVYGTWQEGGCLDGYRLLRRLVVMHLTFHKKKTLLGSVGAGNSLSLGWSGSVKT
jgi:hypothetical protein